MIRWITSLKRCAGGVPGRPASFPAFMADGGKGETPAASVFASNDEEEETVITSGVQDATTLKLVRSVREGPVAGLLLDFLGSAGNHLCAECCSPNIW